MLVFDLIIRVLLNILFSSIGLMGIYPLFLSESGFTLPCYRMALGGAEEHSAEQSVSAKRIEDFRITKIKNQTTSQKSTRSI